MCGNGTVSHFKSVQDRQVNKSEGDEFIYTRLSLLHSASATITHRLWFALNE